MSPTIRVDDEVYALLQSRAEAFVDTPNTVLRRLLDLDVASPGSTVEPAKRAELPSGMLAQLRGDGVLRAGERLVWERRNNGERHIATVTELGQLQLEDGSVHDSPSGAARHVAGYEVNGWRVWRRESDGKSLAAVRVHRPGGRDGSR